MAVDPLVPPPIGNPGSTSTWGESTVDWEAVTGVKPFDWDAALDPNNDYGPEDIYNNLFPDTNPVTTQSSDGPVNNRKYSVKFNAPLYSYAAGKDPLSLARRMANNNGPSSAAVNGNGNIKTDRKGWLMPDTEKFADFDMTTEGVEDSSFSLPSPQRRRGIRGRPVPADKGNLLTGLSTLYGFRFLYNPASISFGIGITPNGVNPGYIYSGKATAMPTGITSNASIGISFPISRVDDLAVIKQTGNQYRLGNGGSLKTNYFDGYRGSLVNGVTKTKGVTEEDIRGIATQGTMYDLNYLFKAAMAKDFVTRYRGRTADVGIVFSFPLVLYLSKDMVYRVRLSNLSYTHKSFTPSMVPMYTEVSLGFERIPDVVGW